MKNTNTTTNHPSNLQSSPLPAAGNNQTPHATTLVAEFHRKSWHYRILNRRTIDSWIEVQNNYGEGDEDILIGFDTEYKPAEEGGKINYVLSYQFCLATPLGELSGIHYPNLNTRIKFSQFLGSVIEIGIKEKLLKRFPKKVSLCGHFTLADMTTFYDLDKIVRNIDCVRKTFVTLEKPLCVSCCDKNNHSHTVSVKIRDSMLLAPGGHTSLAELGEIIGHPKIELPEGQIGKMDEFLRNDQAAFEEYAIRDAEIAVRYCQKMKSLNLKLLNKNDIPITLSSIGLSLLLKSWEESGMKANEILGKEKISSKLWNGTFMQNVETTPLQRKAHHHEAFATECYHGGRNEQYFFGASLRGVWNDWDLKGAYTTALACLGMADWENIRSSTTLADFSPESLGFAEVRFRFPADTRFPCLPVRSDYGLIFPLEGTSYCCSPEIVLAREMGADVEIRDGIIVPQNLTTRPFADFIRFATKQRKSHPKDSLDELAWKELSNGTYGKLAQGLRPKRGYNCRKDIYEQLEPSKITNPYLSAWVTSFVRAVLGEILSKLPADVQVSNATTDGILCTASQEVMEKSTEGTFCNLFKKAREVVVGFPECLEKKHEIAQLIGMMTRGQITLETITEDDFVLAKAGQKLPRASKAEQNRLMAELFIQRKADTKLSVHLLRSLPEIARFGGDLAPKVQNKTVRLDYDWKRRHLDESTRTILGFEHLAFETLPWKNVHEAMKCRQDWTDFSRGGNRVLKSLGDLKDFEEYRATPRLKGKLRRSTKGGSLKVATRQFLRAYTRSVAGLVKSQMSYPELAELLTEWGVPTTREDVENSAKKTALFEFHSVPRTAEVMEYYEKIQGRFPAFQPDELLVNEGCLSLVGGGNGRVSEEECQLLHPKGCSKASRSPDTLLTFPCSPLTSGIPEQRAA